MPVTGKSMLNLSEAEVKAMLPLKELEWQRRYFIPLFLELGWSGHHETDSKFSRTRSADGTPLAALDWWLIRGSDFLFAELKKEGGHLSVGQRNTADMLYGAGINSFLWFPHDWHDIIYILK